jgi:hypothetical protein
MNCVKKCNAYVIISGTLWRKVPTNLHPMKFMLEWVRIPFHDRLYQGTRDVLVAIYNLTLPLGFFA